MSSKRTAIVLGGSPHVSTLDDFELVGKLKAARNFFNSSQIRQR